ncbi:hypothetical protein JXB31_04345 [Candidatus Woesearchaeota archaeon]|nr:hypothetical protein [Candidatus Woesearchaeota archaeon]
MKLKIRKSNPDGVVRLESAGAIKDILINEDILHPRNESISLCFRGKNSSGIIDLTPAEVERIKLAVKNRLHLIKGVKAFRL